MLRGAIEVAEHTRIAGWIVMSATSLRGKTVLAFSGKNCVGSGVIELFRRDLLSVDLGDGYAGFDFPVKLSPDQDPVSIVIRLEYCDAVILQADCELVRRQSVAPLNRPRQIADIGSGRDRKTA